MSVIPGGPSSPQATMMPRAPLPTPAVPVSRRGPAGNGISARSRRWRSRSPVPRRPERGCRTLTGILPGGSRGGRAPRRSGRLPSCRARTARGGVDSVALGSHCASPRRPGRPGPGPRRLGRPGPGPHRPGPYRPGVVKPARPRRPARIGRVRTAPGSSRTAVTAPAGPQGSSPAVPDPREAAPDHLLRPLSSDTPFYPLLRPLFSYSEG